MTIIFKVFFVIYYNIRESNLVMSFFAEEGIVLLECPIYSAKKIHNYFVKWKSWIRIIVE